MFRNMRFAALWLSSWLLAGTHQDVAASANDARLPWATYYRDYVMAVALQGTHRFALPIEASHMVRAYPGMVSFIGSLTARPEVEPPAELEQLLKGKPSELALVGFGTHPQPCPLEILRALTKIGLTAVVLVNDCRDQKEVMEHHILPQSRDQFAWLRSARMRLAVVHGGIHSLHEAVSLGIPVACVPHKGDQWANCKDLQRQKLGWAIHPEAEAAEAAAAFKMLMDGNFSSSIAVDQFAMAGGPAGVVNLVEELAPKLPGRSRLDQDVLERNQAMVLPFFVAPLSWAEGRLIAFLMALIVASLFISILVCCVPSTNGEDKEKPE